MTEQTYRDIAELAGMKTKALQRRYFEVFGEPCKSGNAAYMRKRIAWRIQSLAEGGLSERARKRASELACEADIRQKAPLADVLPKAATQSVSVLSPTRDPRLPKPGTLLTRSFKGRQIVVTVLEDGFSFEGRQYKSLSAIAGEVTGTRWNGFQFFGLHAKENA
ncbi:DUF2924 domain-containing protein [uncultured Desulfovibrio sp.]|uniref:DUF2924 domain-containing protein n=1 Tax=uncultured Desulfovibrio sp. TaxID=167968 RepID=UPI0026187905|nr:DUF2924 domain-containing protein [uncultured Desulfovibrio sp.]